MALKNLIAVLEDPGTSFTPGPLSYGLGSQTTNVRHLLLQKWDGKFYLVLWQGVPSYNLTTKPRYAGYRGDHPIAGKLGGSPGRGRRDHGHALRIPA